ncbi:solute:sodium symporter family transporter [Puia dinghuensis]|uniref:Solute:sodium symporter family transporter n=1 Tax=Puia dinghuensis TaxID=1792502 RepID=A0A8J2UIH9_9BACT|nr:solute:sodium symporter family transporter [Puia dinghuensis]GGB20919.1 solute:sodium symporter family transporter [Puia dinghuensis]
MNKTIFLSFLAFVACAGLVAIYKSRKVSRRTSLAFFLGNRSLGFWMIGCSLFLTNMSANQFIGENEFVYTTNMSVMAWGMSSVFAMLVVAEFLMPVYLRIGAVTTPDFLQLRFDRQTKMMVSVIFLLSYMINLIPSVLYGCAVAINGIFHIDQQFGLSYFVAIRLLVCFLGLIGALYSVLGGFKVIVISDIIQGVGMLAGAVFIAWFGFRRLGGGHVTAGIERLLHAHQDHLNAIGRPHDAWPLSTMFTGMLLINLYYWGMEQYIVQEALASKSLAAGQKGISLACVGKLTAPLLLNVPGLIAVHLYTHLDNTAAVFPRLVGDILPPVLAGFIAAIVFGGALSTFNAGINSLGTLFVINLYRPWAERYKGRVDDRRMLWAGKSFQLLVIVAGVCFSPYILFVQGGFYFYLQKVSSFFSVPVFTVMTVGLLTKKVPAIAAKVGLIFFIVSYVLTQFVFPTGLNHLHVLAILFVLTVALMLIIGRFRPKDAPFKMLTTAVVPLQPWKNRWWAFSILLILMVAMFILFSPMGIAH